ncbi:rod shape-determining protein RodA [Nonlabens marinus]|uniref:Rod shape-determining protein RodA n=1 Tax=Nonlabens marinus S1-08 TaxID=1454201 RepID=W8VZZ4_9FLAO|nr:rod shape-determining protein RodA [Nonlabens marinus]BAO55431.1 rod shape-determining protein RodA [Nonlabens marinus S1-08]
MLNSAIGDKPKFDVSIILIYLALVLIGWVSIYSAAPVEAHGSIFDIDEVYGKQFLWIILAIALIVLIFAIEVKFFERFAGVIYVVSLLSLAGLFVFGKEISGATSWYGIGSMSLQPSEFAKFATALALAKYLSQLDISVRDIKHLFIAGGIVLLPAILIVPQPDPGSALVYGAFFFALHREGLSLWFLLLAIIALVLFIGSLLVGPWWMAAISLVVVGVIFSLSRKRHKNRRGSKPQVSWFAAVLIACIAFAFTADFIFENVFQERHRNRINIVLGRLDDSQGVQYNIIQSEIAIGSGGLSGKGLLKGTQTQGGFVPEQHTDFIFSAIGEEFGLLGAGAVVVLFVLLIYRLVIMAERQRNQFSRIYGYGVAGIFFVHFFVNVGMVLGLLPTVGIPLPFMSYGGSGLWGFTVLLFIFVKLDAHRMSYQH